MYEHALDKNYSASTTGGWQVHFVENVIFQERIFDGTRAVRPSCKKVFTRERLVKSQRLLR